MAVAALALLRPEWFIWFRGQWVISSLALIMTMMGLTLGWTDFKIVARRPWSVALGFGLQYTLMPLLGWTIAWLFRLETPYALGLVLIACCPGGIASNLFTLLGRGDLALSVGMTVVSTLLAFVMTPLLAELLMGRQVPVDAWAMAKSTLQMVVLPVGIGVVLHHLIPKLAVAAEAWSPFLSSSIFLLLTGGIFANNPGAVTSDWGILLIVSMLLHGSGTLLGYSAGRTLKQPETVSRTLAFEVGLQNAGLAIVLAQVAFPQIPTASVAITFCSFTQTLIAASFASFWRTRG